MILVTGATGFLGAHLTASLLLSGEKIRAVKRSGSSFDIWDRVCRFYQVDEKAKDNIEWVETDILDLLQLEKYFNGVKDVYHCAGLVSFQPGMEQLLDDINVKGTANVVNLAIDKNVRKLIHVSSVAAIGRAEPGKPISEKTIWKTSSNNSKYAVSKYNGEREVWRAIEEGLNAVIVNPSIILGPGEINSGSTRMIKTVKEGLKFYTPGTNGFVDVRDVVEIMISLMKNDMSAERFLISAENLSYQKLFEIIARELNVKSPQHLAGSFLSNVAWRLEWLKGKLSGTKPLITKETANTANNHYFYDNSKSIDQLNFQYRGIDDSIKDAVGFLNNSTMS